MIKQPVSDIIKFPVRSIIAGQPIAGFSPADISGLRLWLDATDPATIITSGSNVTGWLDKSGYSNNFSQTDPTKYPIKGTNEIDFSGSLKHLIAGSNYIFSSGSGEETGITIIVLARTTQVAGASANVKFMFDFGGYAGLGYGIGFSSDLLRGYTAVAPIEYAPDPPDVGLGADSFVYPTSINSAYHRITFRVELGVEQEIYLDNVSQVNTAITLNRLNNLPAASGWMTVNANPTRGTGASPMTIGLQGKTDGESLRDFQGHIKAVLVYVKSLSGEERGQIDGYLSALP